MIKIVLTLFSGKIKLERIFLFLLLLPSVLSAQNSIRLFDTYMKGQSGLYQFNGNVLVAKNGKIIYQKSFGYADYHSQKLLDKNSIFDIGSITKEFTSVGILLLEDKGKITLADTLRKFFPELPYSNITVANLLTHTSGVPDGFTLIEKYFDHDKIATNQDMIRILAKEQPPALFNPGENLMYSGTGFNLLASIIEKISGQSYNKYLSENIFKPLGMKSTMVANFPRNNTNALGLAKGFIYMDSEKKVADADSIYPDWASYLSGINGEGMIISTTGDLLKWDRALKNHQLLSEQTQKEMITVHAERKNVPIIKFGYGIRLESNELGDCVFHNGWYPGFKSMLIRYTEQDITVIVLSNNQSQSEFISDGLASIALHKKISMPYVHKEAKIKSTLDKYTGKYMIPLTRPPYMADFPVEIIVKNNTLFIHGPGVPDVELKPESEIKFFYGDGTDQQIEFEKDMADNKNKVFYIGYGVKKEIRKMN
ncbi:MAG: serine hydrolase domain-containing protein [Ginsengibacter sp.]|jgi:CubicO group peptidase (beta-lactamase class C family)